MAAVHYVHVTMAHITECENVAVTRIYFYT